MSNILFAPASEAQQAFLLSKSWFTIYGGAAFAGKSMCLLGSMLPIIHHPGTRALIIRKTTKMLTGSGSLFDAAITLYSKIDPKLKVKSRDLKLVFSSGAEIQFTYLDKPADRMNLQGKEFSRLCLDECQQLDGDNVFYALSRLRSTMVDYPLQVHATCNPDPDSFLMKFVEFSLGDDLIPRSSAREEERYFVRDSFGLHFYNNYDEAFRKHPPDSRGDSPVKSYRFVPGKIFDNPVGLEQNKGYISTLKALPPIESRRLLHGAWVRESKSGYFKRENVAIVDNKCPYPVKSVRAWDLAFTPPSESRPDVDATCGVLVTKDKASVYTVEDLTMVRDRVHVVEEAIFKTASKDGTEVLISLPLDPGATAGAYCKDLARRLAELGYTVKLTRPEKGKLQRFLPFASAVETGYVQFVRANWTDDAFTELEKMDFTNNTHDDVADTLSDAFYHLNQGGVQLPDSFVLPDLSSRVSAFGFQDATIPRELVTKLN
jgi:predicted phage terminase large subunit-like protein